MGQKNNHLKIFCENKDGKPFECVYWNHSELNIPYGKEFDIIFYPKLNTFNGITTIQLDIQDLKSEFSTKEEKSEYKLYDHRKKTNIYRQICDYLLTTKVSTAIFAQNKTTIELLNGYKEIATKIVNRKTIQTCNQIMFFDYPASESVMNDLLKISGAKICHFMCYTNNKINPHELIKNISGMLKYVTSNKNGEVNISDVSDFLSVSDEVTEICIDMLAELNMFEIIENSGQFYKIKFKQAIETSKIKDTTMYDELCSELDNIYNYRKKLCESPLNEIIIY